MYQVPPFEAYSRLIPTVNSAIAIPNLSLVETNPGYQSFDEQASIAIPANPSGFVVVLAINVPDGFNGVITKYSCNFTGGGFIDGSGDLVWQILNNGKPIQNYDSILTERGDPNLPRDVSAINIYSSQVIQFVVNHAANPLLASGYIICTLSGFYYPSSS